MQIILILIKSIIQLLNSPLGISFMSMLTCLCFYFYNHEKVTLKILIRIVYFSIFIFAIYIFLSSLNYRLSSFQVWDFTSFYLWAKVAVQGYNFYLPENSQIIFNSLSLPSEDFQEFIEGIVRVGFLYPPPTMFYFYFLGYLYFDSDLVFLQFFVCCPSVTAYRDSISKESRLWLKNLSEEKVFITSSYLSQFILSHGQILSFI